MGKLLYFEGNLEIIYLFSNVNTKYQKRKINMFHIYIFFLIDTGCLGMKYNIIMLKGKRIELSHLFLK